jgi:hypothetical protein
MLYDPKFNLTDKSYDLNHGELYTNQIYHWTLHQLDFAKASLGVNHARTQELIKKAAKEVANLVMITMEEVKHYKNEHPESYFTSLKEYPEFSDVPKGKLNFALTVEDMCNIDNISPVIKNDVLMVDKMKRKQ